MKIAFSNPSYWDNNSGGGSKISSVVDGLKPVFKFAVHTNGVYYPGIYRISSGYIEFNVVWDQNLFMGQDITVIDLVAQDGWGMTTWNSLATFTVNNGVWKDAIVPNYVYGTVGTNILYRLFQMDATPSFQYRAQTGLTAA